MQSCFYLVVLLGTASACGAQVIEVSGGASNAYGAEGGAVHVRGQKLDAAVGLGFVQGGFAAGGALTRALPNGTLTLGQQELHMDLPTDVFDSAHFLFATGLGWVRTTRSGSMQSFIGYASQEGGTPLFRAATLGRRTQFLQWTRPVSRGCNGMMTELMGSSSAALLSVGCAVSSHLKLASSVGMGGGSPYVAVSAVLTRRTFHLRTSYSYANEHFQRGNNPFQPTPEPVRENAALDWKISRPFTLSAAHGNYLTGPGQAGATGAFTIGTVHSSLDSIGLQLQQRRYGASVSVLRSTYNTSAPAHADGLLIPHAENAALTASFRYSRQRWQLGQILLYSLKNTASGSQSIILSNTLGVNVSPHLRLTEGVNVSDSGTTFSHGGALLTRYSSFEADYQFFYVAGRPDRPFQQALLFSAEMQLPAHFALHASSTLDAAGRPLYVVQLGKSLFRNQAAAAIVQTSFGESLVRGRVVDDQGRPVEGAVVRVGEQRLYTDSDGFFQFRERRSTTHALQVLTEEFSAVGAYSIVSAPQSVRSERSAASTPVRIVVARVSETQVAQNGPIR